jgi:hypothetical protein
MAIGMIVICCGDNPQQKRISKGAEQTKIDPVGSVLLWIIALLSAEC